MKRSQAIASHKKTAEYVRIGGIVDKLKRRSTTLPLLSVVNFFEASGLKIYVYNKESYSLERNLKF
jgi:hypothetical protein